MIQNINRSNRGNHVVNKSSHESWPYLNHFQVTANRMKKSENCAKPLISEISKDATQKRNPYLKRSVKILQTQ